MSAEECKHIKYNSTGMMINGMIMHPAQANAYFQCVIDELEKQNAELTERVTDLKNFIAFIVSRGTDMNSMQIIREIMCIRDLYDAKLKEATEPKAED